MAIVDLIAIQHLHNLIARELMHQNILVLTLHTLNGARLGLGHFANKQPDLLEHAPALG